MVTEWFPPSSTCSLVTVSHLQLTALEATMYSESLICTLQFYETRARVQDSCTDAKNRNYAKLLAPFPRCVTVEIITQFHGVCL